MKAMVEDYFGKELLELEMAWDVFIMDEWEESSPTPAPTKEKFLAFCNWLDLSGTEELPLFGMDNQLNHIASALAYHLRLRPEI